MSDQPEKTLPPAARPLEPGMTLGPFQLLRLLGEGGMGQVFVAEDTKLGRNVALKVMKPDVAKEERARKMFLREARSAASIGHDRVVTIYEANEADGVPYIAMELLAGESLADFLERTPRPPLPVALTIAYQVAEGLHVAHQKGLIHRDIKPANVWLRATPGRPGIDVRLLDFGLARAAAGDTISTGGAGKALGTPLYMAPEQWDGKGVDHQSDLFSLGVMLYRMLTGRPPFAGDSVKEVMFQICMPNVVPVVPREIDPAIPVALSDFVMRTIAKDKSGRVASGDEVMRELARLKKNAGASTMVPVVKPLPLPPMVGETTPVHGAFEATRSPLPRPGVKPVSRFPAGPVIAVVVFLVAVVGAYFLFRDGKADRDTTQRESTGGPRPTQAVGKPDPPPPPTPRKEQADNPPPTKPTPKPEPPQTVPMPEPPKAVPPAKVRPDPLDCTGPTGSSVSRVLEAQRQWAEFLGVDIYARVDLGGGVGMDFVLVPPGKYWMGSTEDELDALVKLFPSMTKSNCLDETPRHPMTISRPMYVGKTEVTYGQFRRFPPADPKEGEKPDWPGYDESHPVVNVSWNGAKAFAAAIPKSALPAGFRSPRLPTEAEWEYVCRAGTVSRYPNGSDDPESLVKIGNVFDKSGKTKYPIYEAIATDDGHATTAPVATFAANRFGLYDTIGNAWEWCDDGYDEAAYKGQVSTDRHSKHSDHRRMLRGGSWFYFPWFSRPASRLGYGATNRNDGDGFRLALPQDSE